MILRTLKSSNYLQNKYFEHWGKSWVSDKIKRFKKYISKSDKILDIGSGNCLLAFELIQQGFLVTPLDIENQSYSPKINPVIYDGATLPFKEKEFDVALLLSVLHHCVDPIQVLKEASRVAKKVIIIEDVYSNSIGKFANYGVDAFINLGYSPMEFQHKTDNEWREIFASKSLLATDFEHFKVLGVFEQIVYVLVKHEMNKQY